MTTHEVTTKSQSGYKRTNEVTVDAAGVARWAASGNVVPEDLIEQVAAQVAAVDVEASRAARDEDTRRAVAAYREMRNRHGYSTQERAAIRAAFGPGADVVDVLTGEKV